MIGLVTSVFNKMGPNFVLDPCETLSVSGWQRPFNKSDIFVDSIINGRIKFGFKCDIIKSISLRIAKHEKNYFRCWPITLLEKGLLPLNIELL